MALQDAEASRLHWHTTAVYQGRHHVPCTASTTTCIPTSEKLPTKCVHFAEPLLLIDNKTLPIVPPAVETPDAYPELDQQNRDVSVAGAMGFGYQVAMQEKALSRV